MLKEKREKKELARVEPARGITPFEEMEKWFDEFFRRPFSMLGAPWWTRGKAMEIGEVSSSVDMYEEEDDIVVKAEVPGMKKEDLDVSLTEDTITISGEKRLEEKVERKNFYRSECSYGSFFRSFRLPKEVRPDQAKAKFENGILEIRIPMTEEAKKKERRLAIE